MKMSENVKIDFNELKKSNWNNDSTFKFYNISPTNYFKYGESEKKIWNSKNFF